MSKPASPLAVSEEQMRMLHAWVAARNSPQKMVLRSRIVLLAHEGVANRVIARRLHTSRPTVLRWRERFVQGGLEGISLEAPGRGRPPRIAAAQVAKVVEATLHSKPAGATHWSTRTMAKAQGISHSTVQRIWEAHGLQPHRTKTFKLSQDKRFVEKLQEVVGLYLNPPQKALVLCVCQSASGSDPLSASKTDPPRVDGISSRLPLRALQRRSAIAAGGSSADADFTRMWVNSPRRPTDRRRDASADGGRV